MTEIIRISKEIHKEVKILCAHKELKIKEYVESALKKQIESDKIELDKNFIHG